MFIRGCINLMKAILYRIPGVGGRCKRRGLVFDANSGDEGTCSFGVVDKHNGKRSPFFCCRLERQVVTEPL